MLIRVILFAALAYGIYLAIRWLINNRVGGGFGSSAKLQCATCRHCRKLFDDGSTCGFGPRETFKNETHIRNCIDYSKR